MRMTDSKRISFFCVAKENKYEYKGMYSKKKTTGIILVLRYI